jgi:hypothetical protein
MKKRTFLVPSVRLASLPSENRNIRDAGKETFVMKAFLMRGVL